MFFKIVNLPLSFNKPRLLVPPSQFSEFLKVRDYLTTKAYATNYYFSVI